MLQIGNILGLLNLAISSSYCDYLLPNELFATNKYFTLNATIYFPGWNIDCDSGVWQQNARDMAGDVCSNWYGWDHGSWIGSISTTFNGVGRAQLDFGNCWTSGIVNATLDGTVIASAPMNTPSMTVEFDFDIGSILKIAEYGVLQFNTLNIIQCNGENYDGKFIL